MNGGKGRRCREGVDLDGVGGGLSPSVTTSTTEVGRGCRDSGETMMPWRRLGARGDDDVSMEGGDVAHEQGGECRVDGLGRSAGVSGRERERGVGDGDGGVLAREGISRQRLAWTLEETNVRVWVDISANRGRRGGEANEGLSGEHGGVDIAPTGVSGWDALQTVSNDQTELEQAYTL